LLSFQSSSTRSFILRVGFPIEKEVKGKEGTNGGKKEKGRQNRMKCKLRKGKGGEEEEGGREGEMKE
jgi:hypothetical protein